MGLPFTIAAGPGQRSHSGPRPAGPMTTFYCFRFETPQPGGPGPSIYIHPGTGWPSNELFVYQESAAVATALSRFASAGNVFTATALSRFASAGNVFTELLPSNGLLLSPQEQGNMLQTTVRHTIHSYIRPYSARKDHVGLQNCD
jgi:hypothetical protein